MSRDNNVLKLCEEHERFQTTLSPSFVTFDLHLPWIVEFVRTGKHAM